jgi:hypothetical protein
MDSVHPELRPDDPITTGAENTRLIDVPAAGIEALTSVGVNSGGVLDNHGR